jgi:hypothetical protein
MARKQTARPLGPPDGTFDRKPVSSNGRTMIESKCRECGKQIVGSVYEGTLLEAEDRHRAVCPDGKIYSAGTSD